MGHREPKALNVLSVVVIASRKGIESLGQSGSWSIIVLGSSSSEAEVEFRIYFGTGQSEEMTRDPLKLEQVLARNLMKSL